MQPLLAPHTLAIVNKWGNIDLTKIKLSKRYKHVRGKRLQPLCRRLGIRYATAVVSWWDAGRLPRRDGVVVSAVSAPKLRQEMLERDQRLEVQFIKRHGNDSKMIFIRELGGELRMRGFEVARRVPPMRVFAGNYVLWVDDYDGNEILIRGRADLTSQMRNILRYYPKTDEGRVRHRAMWQQWESKFPNIFQPFDLCNPNSLDLMLALFEEIRSGHAKTKNNPD